MDLTKDRIMFQPARDKNPIIIEIDLTDGGLPIDQHEQFEADAKVLHRILQSRFPSATYEELAKLMADKE